MKQERITRTLATAIGLAIAIYAILTVKARRDDWVWDHWDVVKPGVLYRSGQLQPDQLKDACRLYGIKTIMSFLAPGPEMEAERALARELGVGFVNYPMPGDGFGKEEQFRAALAIIDDPARRPVLAHCARGTCRTGAMVAYYRFMRDGWTIEDVAAEMDRQVYRDGWLPGYVYQMAKSHPFYELNADETSLVPQNAKQEQENGHAR